MLEAAGLKKWGDLPEYRKYLENTPSLIPFIKTWVHFFRLDLPENPVYNTRYMLLFYEGKFIPELLWPAYNNFAVFIALTQSDNIVLYYKYVKAVIYD